MGTGSGRVKHLLPLPLMMEAIFFRLITYKPGCNQAWGFSFKFIYSKHIQLNGKQVRGRRPPNPKRTPSAGGARAGVEASTPRGKKLNQAMRAE